MYTRKQIDSGESVLVARRFFVYDGKSKILSQHNRLSCCRKAATKARKQGHTMALPFRREGTWAVCVLIGD